MPFFVMYLREIIDHYSKLIKTPQYSTVSPRIPSAPYVPILVEYLRVSVYTVLNMNAEDIVSTLDIIYSRVVNEQRHAEYLTNKYKKRH